MNTDARKTELESKTPAELRGIAMRFGKAFAKPRTAGERREIVAWILAAEAAR